MLPSWWPPPEYAIWSRTLDRRSRVELVAGLTVLLVAGCAAILTIFLGGASSPDNAANRYQVYFHFLSDLKPTARVRYAAGIPCGRVTGMSIDGHLARIEVTLDDGVLIGEKTVFRIGTSGLLGEKYLIVDNPEPVIDPLPVDSEIRGKDPVDIDMALQEIGEVVSLIHNVSTGGKPGEDYSNSPLVSLMSEGQELISSLNQAVETKDAELTEVITDARGFISDAGHLVLNLDTAAEQANSLIAAVSPEKVTRLMTGITMLVRDLHGTVTTLRRDLEGLSSRLDMTVGAVNSLVANADTTLTSLSGDLGSSLRTVSRMVSGIEEQLADLLVTGNDILETSFNDPQGGNLHEIRRDVATVTRSLAETAPALIERTDEQISDMLVRVNGMVRKAEDAVNVLSAAANNAVAGLSGQSAEGASPQVQSLSRILENILFLTEQLRAMPIFNGDANQFAGD